MAQKPIGYYGEFRPTGVDQSAARRFEALAGLAGQVGDIAAAFGKKKVAEQRFLEEQTQIEEAAAAARLAGNAAAIGKEPLELKQYDSYRDFKADQKFNETAKAAYAAGIQNEITKIVDDAAAQHPEDIVSYKDIAAAGVKGLLQATDPDLRPAFDIYFDQINRRAASRITNAEKTRDDAANLAEIETALEDEEVNLINLARQGDEDGLLNAGLIYSERGKQAIALGLDDGTFATRSIALKDRIAQQTALGTFSRQVLQNNEQTVEKRIEVGQSIIDQINDADLYKVKDPIDPEKTITLDADEKDTLVAKLEDELKDFKADELKKAETKIEVSRFKQISNYAAAQETVQDPTLSDKEKKTAIAEDEMKGNIGGEEAAKLRRYVNSVEALNAVTNSEVMGDIIARAYDLNADFDVDANSNNYLQGVNNLREDIIVARTNGELSADDELKLNNQLKTLTAAKIAGATSEIAMSYNKADQKIKGSLQPDLWGVARRQLLDAVRLEKEQKELEIGKPLTRREELKLWSDLAPGVISEIQENRRAKSVERVKEILETPTITTQAEFDDLPSGSKFIENGVEYEKP